MIKFKIYQDGKLIKTVAKSENLEINISLFEDVKAAWYDKVNVAENKTMDQLCADVADILKNEYGFKILKEDRMRYDSKGNRVITDGHPSDYKDSLSLYYYVRYDMILSDDFIDDGFQFSSLAASVKCDIIIKVTNHGFIAIGDLKTRKFDSSKLKQLSNQEGSSPMYKDLTRREIEISDIIKTDYNKGLQEIRDNIKSAIGEWRPAIYNAIKSLMNK